MPASVSSLIGCVDDVGEWLEQPAGEVRLAVVTAWFSSLTDRRLVDGLVNMVGWVAQEVSFGFRRLQTGLVQNYALVMLLGVALFVGVYLVVR